MKNVYILYDDSSRASMYGIGTYVDQLLKCLQLDSELRIYLLRLNSDRTEFVRECNSLYTTFYFPKIHKNESFIEYYRSIIYLLCINIDNQCSSIFHLNYLWEYDLIPYIRRFFPNSKIVLSVHHQQWGFSLCGNVKLFNQIILDSYCVDLNMEDVSYIKKGFNEEKEFYESVDYIISLSSFTKNILIDLYNITESKIVHIYNGIIDLYTELSEFDKYNLRKKYNFDKNDKILLYVGRLDEIKGVSFMIESFKSILDSYPNAYLLIIGEGDFKRYLFESNFIRNRVLFMGLLDRNILYDMYRISDLGILFSFHEQCSYVAIEMMMFNLPIVTTDSTGLKEMFPGYKYVCSVQYDQFKPYLRMNECKNNIIELLEIGGDNSIRKIYKEMFDLNIIKSQILSFYHSV